MKSSSKEKWIVCRICLRQSEEAMQAIFDDDEQKDLTQMILDCGGVPIKRFDHYPDKICPKCLKYLHVAHKFRTTCQRSYKHLSRFIAPVEEENLIEANVEQEFVLELNEAEDIAMKLEPVEGAAEPMGIKEEMWDAVGDDVMYVYEPLEEGDDGEEFEEFETIDHYEMSDLELIEEEDPGFVTSDEEYKPDAKVSPKKGKIKAGKSARKRSAQQPSTSRASATVKKDKPAKRGPKPKKNKETSYICDICGNIYPSQGRLTEHIKLHKGIKPHECEICGHAFAQSQQLERHMNTHTGNRPYKCSYCPAAFADLSTRNKHHRIHTNERPYVCDVCGKSFTYTNTLKFHKMIHTGEKPHVCDLCGKGFQQAYKLRSHKLTHEKKGIKLEKIEVETLDNYQEVNAAAAQILEI